MSTTTTQNAFLILCTLDFFHVASSQINNILEEKCRKWGTASGRDSEARTKDGYATNCLQLNISSFTTFSSAAIASKWLCARAYVCTWVYPGGFLLWSCSLCILRLSRSYNTHSCGHHYHRYHQHIIIYILCWTTYFSLFMGENSIPMREWPPCGTWKKSSLHANVALNPAD